jgi:hypothetical protein
MIGPYWGTIARWTAAPIDPFSDLNLRPIGACKPWKELNDSRF